MGQGASRLTSSIPFIVLVLCFGCTSKPVEKAAESLRDREPFSASAPVTFLEEDLGAYVARTEDLFEDEDFDAWEEEGQAALNSVGRFADGLTMAEVYFDELDRAQDKWNAADPFRFRESVEKWQGRYPESHAARIAMIYVLVDNAWKKRGSGFSNTVTEAGWKNFESYLRKAHDAYDACLRDGIKYPAVHTVALRIATGEGWSRDEVEQTLLAGIEQDPLYQSLYRAMAWYLLPKWHGSAEDPRDFFYQSRDLARPEAGGAMGFVVAWFFADQEEAQNDEFEFRIPWQDLRACYTDFAKVFPDAMEAHNRMALFAIRFHKKTEAAEIFRSAATSHHSGVWPRPAYDAWKAFAVDGAAAPTHSELHEAAAKGDIDGAKKLLSGLDNVDILNGNGLTPLYYAVNAGHQDAAQALLEAGADANAVIDGEGHTLLNVAINATDDAMAVLLVDHGADFRVESSPGRPLFHRFFHKGMLDVAEKIVREHGGDVNVRDADGYTALHIVAASGDVDNVRRLLELGAQIDAQNALGMTPLLSAVNADHEACASHLVKQGAAISLTMNDGLSPLHAAVDHSFKGLVGMLLELGVDVNQKDLDGWTALHMATMNGNKSMLTMLLDAPGADVNIATNEGRTLVHQAAKSGHVDLLRVLVEHGAALNTRNNAGKTALDLALDEEMMAAAEFLESAGAERGT